MAFDFSSPITANILLYAKWKTAESSGTDDSGGGTPNTLAPETISQHILALTGDEVELNGVIVSVPSETLTQDTTFSITRLNPDTANTLISSGLQVSLGSDVYEINTTGVREFGDKTITIKMPYDPSKIAPGETPVIHYLDENKGEWRAVRTILQQDSVSGRWYAVIQINHLTKFAVFSTKSQEIILTIGQKVVLVGGKEYTIDAEPILEPSSNRTLVPIRFISEALGYKVDWNSATKQVKVSSEVKQIILALGQTKVLLNGQVAVIDCAPLSYPPGRTFVPLRFISETMGITVEYNQLLQQIIIFKGIGV